jgi:hypothetical protein
VGGFDEGIEESGVDVRRFFWVPLHGYAKVDRGQFNAFNDSVRRSRRNDEVATQLFDGLVVVHLSASDCVAHDAFQVRSALDGHVHGGKRSSALLVVIVPDHLRKVLDEASTLMNVEHLGAAANAEEREVCGYGGSEQVVFELVPVTTWLVRGLVSGFPVASRINILAAGNNQTVEVRHDVARRVRI